MWYAVSWVGTAAFDGKLLPFHGLSVSGWQLVGRLMYKAVHAVVRTCNGQLRLLGVSCGLGGNGHAVQAKL